MKRTVPLSLRLFLVFGLFVLITGYFLLKTVFDEIKPGVRQSTEETLVDTANLLAELLGAEAQQHALQPDRLANTLAAYARRNPQASIWGMAKSSVDLRIYITDQRGVVLFDSSGTVVGQDYSRWNDVYLTLQGRYGVRTTQDIPGDEGSTVMHVAAPIMAEGKIMGVVTVAKPNRTLQPYIERSQRKLVWLGGSLIALGLLIGGLLSWWLSHSLRRLTTYARSISSGQRISLPSMPQGELRQLAAALDSMRTQLDGKAYIEQYVQTLTHELKSPLAAIRGAAELLRKDMPETQRERFLTNIERETERSQQLTERLLNLAQVEQQQSLSEVQTVNLNELIADALHGVAARVQQQQLQINTHVPAALHTVGERFLLRHAIGNLLDNAYDFTPPGGRIEIVAEADGQWLAVHIRNEGPAIPDYALPRLTERFFSLPRPLTGRKSTGLGLNFVQEVAQLHGGRVEVVNVANGVQATLRISRARP